LSNLPSRKPGRESALISPSTMDSTHSATNPIGKYHIGFTAQMVRLSIARVERIAHLSATWTVRQNGGPGARIAGHMDAARALTACGLTVWLAALVAAAAFVRTRMRCPKSMYAGRWGRRPPGWAGAISGLVTFAVTAFFVPTVAWGVNWIASVLVIYALGSYVVALTVERRRAMRLGLPEPGTDGTTSFAEFVVFLAIAALFALTALGLTVYGIANELGANRGEGGAALGLGVAALFVAIFMGLFASPLLLARRRR